MIRLAKWLTLHQYAVHAGLGLIFSPVAWFLDSPFLSGFLLGLAICNFTLWIYINMENARRELNKMGVHYADGKRYRLTPEPFDNLQPTNKTL